MTTATWQVWQQWSAASSSSRDDRAYIIMACIVMARTVMTYTVMTYVFMAYIDMTPQSYGLCVGAMTTRPSGATGRLVNNNDGEKKMQQ